MGEKIVQSGHPGYITKMILGVFCKKQIKLYEKTAARDGCIENTQKDNRFVISKVVNMTKIKL
jgi:hypothetical protein